MSDLPGNNDPSPRRRPPQSGAAESGLPLPESSLPESSLPATSESPQAQVAGASRRKTAAGPGPVATPEVASSPTPPLLLSLGLHLLLLVVIAWLVSGVPKGSGSQPDRPIGIAMVHRLPDRDRYEEVTPETEATTDQDQSAADQAAAAAAPPADLTPPIDLQGILSAMQTTPAPQSGTGISGDSKLSGDAFGSGDGTLSMSEVGDKATARLFGVSGSGTRFVYVLDRSDSMNGFGGLPLRSAKRELIRSLNSLSPQQQFQIIFYNENVKPFRLAGSPLTMISGEANHLKRAERYIEAIQAFGGTKHKGALLMALRMSPDVVFFLTDAHIPRLSQLELQQIQDRAESAGATIHAIEFGSRPGPARDSFLKDLARMNNGQYQYVDVRRLGREPTEASGGEPEDDRRDEAGAP